MKGIKDLIIFISPLIVGWLSLFLGAYGVTPPEFIKLGSNFGKLHS